MNPAKVVSALEQPPPGRLFFSKTVVGIPAAASTIAADKPLGPEPMTVAVGLSIFRSETSFPQIAAQLAAPWRQCAAEDYGLVDIGAPIKEVD
jgi:hypothetical protein